MRYIEAKKCSKCGKPATQWSGYTKAGKKVTTLAGWCSLRCLRNGVGRVPGRKP